ncbi:hypothetical protein OIU77_030842, partial [Salix suchowensis]
MVEELGRRKVNHGDVYIVRFYNRLDETKKGENKVDYLSIQHHSKSFIIAVESIACPTAGEAQKWMEAFNHGKQQ